MKIGIKMSVVVVAFLGSCKTSNRDFSVAKTSVESGTNATVPVDAKIKNAINAVLIWD